jgi:tetratricopeptide (TPR) repeat protein
MRSAGVVVLMALVFLGTARAEEDERSVKSLYEAALRHEEARRYRTALACYEKVLELDEDYEDAFERHEACERLTLWQSGLTGEPTAPDLVRLGEILAELGRPVAEAKAYEDAIALDSGCADAHGHLALLHYAGRGYAGSLAVVIRETKKLLETSPNRERLKRAWADFDVYGELRLFRSALATELREAKAAAADGRPLDAAEILEEAAKREVPDAFRTRLLAEAGWKRREGGDRVGARKTLEEALRHADCASTGHAHLILALLELDEGRPARALERLRAAVRSGSGACDVIDGWRESHLRALFTSDDEAVRKEMEVLADAEKGDEPIRAAIREACERAGREKKLVLLHFYGPYCPYVMAMEERLADPEIRALLEKRFVHYRVDLGSHHRGMTIDREYGGVFDEHGVPSFFVLEPDGSIRAIQKDVELMGPSGRGYDRGRILDWLRSSLTDPGVGRIR